MSEKLNFVVDASYRAQRIVGREELIEQLKSHVYTEDKKLHVCTITGDGGMGKSRLLEHIESWQKDELSDDPFAEGSADVLIAHTADMIDLDLHARSRFIEHIRNNIDTNYSGFEASFIDLDETRGQYLQMRAGGMEPYRLDGIEAQLANDFLAAMGNLTQQRRVVWLIDTAELLNVVPLSGLGEEAAIFTDADGIGNKILAQRTHYWLCNLVRDNSLTNLTIIIVGRYDERGKPFFNRMNEAVEYNPDVVFDPIELPRFTLKETKDYFTQLAQDWLSLATADEQDAVKTKRSPDQIRRHFELLIDRNIYQVIHRYTLGIPLFLAMYAQVTIDSKMPQAFRQRVESLDSTNVPLHRWEVEDGFIGLLFKEESEQQRLIRILVRAPFGLTAAQLHYLLRGEKGQKPEDWRKSVSAQELTNFVDYLGKMSDIYLVKRRTSADKPHLAYLLSSPAMIDAHATLVSLQDEVYRIYADHMGANEDDAIWEQLTAARQASCRESRAYEQKERQEMYRQLETFATYWRDQFREQKRHLLEDEEQAFERQLLPDKATTFQFPPLQREGIERRIALERIQNKHELDRMRYALMRDPEYQFNESYVDLAYRKENVSDGDFDFLAQMLMWQVIRDENNLRFVEFRQRAKLKTFKEKPLATLVRVAEQENVVRWLKRLILMFKYPAAEDFYAAIESQIDQMRPQEEGMLAVERNWMSWKHTISDFERFIWYTYLHVLQVSPQAKRLVKEAETQLRNYLVPMMNKSNQHKPVRVRHDLQKEAGFSLKTMDEHGFAPVFSADNQSEEVEAHPALTRIKRLISFGYNVIGYGYVTLGKVNDAIRCYGHAVYYIRMDDDLMRAHLAVVLNNLSRALLDGGLPATQVCHDGLEIRKQIGAEVPIAYSHNTMALILDDMNDPERAWKFAAKAVAYFRRADESRGLALSLLQLAEALRRMAGRAKADEILLADSIALYSTANTLLQESQRLLKELREQGRRIEAAIETGCLSRDRILSKDAVSRTSAHRFYNAALSQLKWAEQAANDINITRAVIDARVNIAYTHHYFGKKVLAFRAIWAIEQQMDQAYRIQRDAIESDFITDGDEKWVYQQWSKLCALHAQLHFDQYQEKIKQLRQVQKVDEASANVAGSSKQLRQKQHSLFYRQFDLPAAQQSDELRLALHEMAETAEQYLLAFNYAKLFSPRAPSISLLFDKLYTQLRSLNPRELTKFEQLYKDVSAKYRQSLDNIRKATNDAIDLNVYIDNYFGKPAELPVPSQK